MIDGTGMLVKDKAEPVDNLITWIFDEGTFKPAAKLKDGKTYSIVNDYLEHLVKHMISGRKDMGM